MEQQVQLAKRRLEELISFFGLNVAVEAEQVDEGVELQVLSDSTGRLIGRHGETLRALQHLVSMMMKEAAPGVRFTVDIAGYRKAQAEKLAEMAKEAAAKAVETGEEVVLRPMNAGERRLVHMALHDSEEVETESRGEDPYRRIVIKKRSS
jgi:spoIIIJ-associated protein